MPKTRNHYKIGINLSRDNTIIKSIDVPFINAAAGQLDKVSFSKQKIVITANILYSTRNSIVHAISNYEPNGLECPPYSLEEVNQMMSSIGRALIQWNENQADYIRV